MMRVKTYCKIRKIEEPQCIKCPKEYERICGGKNRLVIIEY